MTRQRLLCLGLATMLSGTTGCHSCGRDFHDRPGLFGWRERARERQNARDRDQEFDPVRPRLGDPIRPSDTIPPPEIPFGPLDSGAPSTIPDSRYRIDPDIGPSPGSWVGPTQPRRDLPPWPSEVRDTPSRPDKVILEPDPLPTGPSAPPAVLELPGEMRSSNRPVRGYLEDPIPPQSLPKRADSTPAPISSDRPPLPNSDQIVEKPATPAPALEAPLKPGFDAGGVLPQSALVPGFRDVYTGRKPALEGFDQLKANGVRTVMYLYAPRADLSAPRSMAEKAGLDFEPIEVSPSRLPEAMKQFRELVQDSSRRPVFVFDDTGARAGVLWYVYFREQQYSDEVARVRAGSLGLNQLSMTGDDRELWNAAMQLVR